MKRTRLTTIAALCGSCAILTAQPKSQMSGMVDPEPQPGELARYDADGDGTLSAAEQKVMREEKKNLAIMHAKGVTARYDKDGDGKLSDEERAAMTRDDEARRATANTRWDKDGDGQLSDEEKQAMHRQNAADRKALLEKYDANKNGILDQEEMEAADKAGGFADYLSAASENLKPGSEARSD